MTRHLVSFIALGVLCVVSAGCQDHNHYQIELTPDGPALNRQLTCWRERREKKETNLLNFFEKELGALETVYGKPSEQPEPRHYRFSGRFEVVRKRSGSTFIWESLYSRATRVTSEGQKRLQRKLPKLKSAYR